MLGNLFKARASQFAAYAAVYTSIVLAVLVLLNFLANRVNLSYDTTSNKRYSLSDQSQKIVKNLKQDVTVTYFDSPAGFQAARDLLNRYESLSTKLKIKYVDYRKEPLLTRAAGVRQAGTTVIEAASGKRDEAKSVTEEELTGALIRVLKEGDRIVCFVTGLGEHSPDDTEGSGYSSAKEVAERSTYKVKAISLLDKGEVPKECTVAVIGGPRREYPEPVAQAIKKYVEGGGKAMFLLDPPVKGLREDIGDNPELAKVLAGWGVTPMPEVVLDASGAGRFFRMGPEVPLIAKYESHAIVREMKETASAMPMARPLEVKSPTGKATSEKLFTSMDEAYAKASIDLKSDIMIDPAKDKKGPFVLGAAGTYDTGQPNNHGRFVVFGSSSFAMNGYIRFGGNRDLFGNALNWLAADEDLISIRPKDPDDRRIQATRSQMSALMWTALVILPLSIIAAGVSVWWRRR